MISIIGSTSYRVFRYIGYSFFVCISLVLSSCVYDPIYYDPPPRTQYYPEYYDYYYYPSVRVYFHFTTGFYYYFDRNRWIKSRALPPNVYIDAKDRVRIRVESDKPFEKQSEHYLKYAPKPTFRVNKERSLAEQKANREWFQKFKQKQDRREKDKKIRNR